MVSGVPSGAGVDSGLLAKEATQKGPLSLCAIHIPVVFCRERAIGHSVSLGA